MKGYFVKGREGLPAVYPPAEIPEGKARVKRKKDVRIDIYKAWCKACGVCVAFCPAHVFSRDEEGFPQVRHPEGCINCGWCEIHCPDFAISVQEKKSGAKKPE